MRCNLLHEIAKTNIVPGRFQTEKGRHEGAPYGDRSESEGEVLPHITSSAAKK